MGVIIQKYQTKMEVVMGGRYSYNTSALLTVTEKYINDKIITE
jgi:hypothetical protein